MTITQIFKSVSSREWRFVIFLSLAMILVTTALLIYGYLITPSGQTFTGVHFAAPNDWFVYYSYLEQARQGNFLFKDLFASESHLPVLNIFWLAVGLAAKIFSLGNIAAFNLARIILVPIFYLVAYLFLAYFFSDAGKRKIAILLLSFSSGLGLFLINRLIQYPFNFANGVFNWPMDLWVPESNTFLTLYYSPHFIAALTLILLTFFLTVLFVENKKLIYSFGAGLSALVLFAFHPFHVLTVLGVIFVYFATLMVKRKKWSWPLLSHYLILSFLSLPAIGYYLYLLKVDWVTQQRAAQNLAFTTPFWITFFSYGLLLLFAVAGIYFLVKQRKFSNKSILLIVWVLVQFGLIYFPVNYQRRMTAGLHFPLVILTTIVFFAFYHWLKRQKNQFSRFLFNQRYTLLIILAILLIGSNLFQLATDFFIYTNQREFSYLDNEIIAAAKWLKAVDSGKIIFNSADNIINFIPAYAGRTVYVGHGVETPAFSQKQDEVDWFFGANRDQAVERQFLVDRNVNYIFYGPIEQGLGDYSPAAKPYLQEVYSNSQVKIYQVL